MTHHTVGIPGRICRCACIFIAGVAAVLFSSCSQREADAGSRTLPSTAARPVADTTSAKETSRLAAEERFGDQGVLVPAATVQGAVGAVPPTEKAMPTTQTHDEARPVLSGNGPASSGSVDEDRLARPQPKALLTPLVAVVLSPALKLDAQQAAAAVRLGRDFLAATEAAPVDTQSTAQVAASADADPVDTHATVDATWRSAQEESDALFKAMFGYAAFNAQQLMRAQQAYRDQLAAGR